MDGSKIKRIREIVGKTQDEIAKKLNITTQAYSRIERGKTSIEMNRLNKIAEAFGMTIEEILKFDDKKFLISGNNTNNGEANENALQFHLTINEAPNNEKVIEMLEKIIEQQKEEIQYLRKQLENLIVQNN